MEKKTNTLAYRYRRNRISYPDSTGCFLFWKKLSFKNLSCAGWLPSTQSQENWEIPLDGKDK